MANDHYIERCKHGKVLSQCRCPGPKTEYTVECNPELCPTAAMANDDVIVRAVDWYCDDKTLLYQRGSILRDLIDELRASRARVAELEATLSGRLSPEPLCLDCGSATFDGGRCRYDSINHRGAAMAGEGEGKKCESES